MKNTANLDNIAFLRLPQVLTFIPISKTAWYEGIKSGIYPKQIKLSKRCSAWRVEDIRNLIAELGGEA